MTTQPRKQRKRQYNAPLHLRHKQLHATLSAELRQQHGCRNARVNTGDTIEVLRGDSAGETGKIIQVDLKRKLVFADGITAEKGDGEEYPIPLVASNLRITKLDLSDPIRKSKLEVIS
tara:strand:- start:2393 stop:2746 length:354 start_codon:yes stop_codon:yes gene_type:complete